MSTWLLNFLRPSKYISKLSDMAGNTRAALAHARQTKNKAGSPRRILVSAHGGIGNAIQSTPLVLALRSLWPDAFIVFMGPPGDLFHDWSAVNCVVQDVIEAQKLGPFDRTFVTFASNLGADWPIVFKNKHFGEISMPGQPLNQPFLKPEWEYCLDLARACGFKGFGEPLYVSLSKPVSHFPVSGLNVCFVPGSKPEKLWRHKRWPYFEELAKLLIARFPQMTLLILGTKDDPISESLLKLERVLDLRGEFTLAETAWSLKHVDLVIGNDCGPSHIADAVLTEHLVLFGPSCEIKNGPRNHGWPVRVPISCSPCQYDHKVLDSCLNAVCMESMSPNLVFSRAEQILSLRGF